MELWINGLVDILKPLFIFYLPYVFLTSVIYSYQYFSGKEKILDK
jgi:hypothetical protein